MLIDFIKEVVFRLKRKIQLSDEDEKKKSLITLFNLFNFDFILKYI